MGSCFLMGWDSFCKIERVMEIGYTMWMYLTLLNCTIKKVWDDKLTLCIFYTIKNYLYKKKIKQNYFKISITNSH